MPPIDNPVSWPRGFRFGPMVSMRDYSPGVWGSKAAWPLCASPSLPACLHAISPDCRVKLTLCCSPSDRNPSAAPQGANTLTKDAGQRMHNLNIAVQQIKTFYLVSLRSLNVQDCMLCNVTVLCLHPNAIFWTFDVDFLTISASDRVARSHIHPGAHFNQSSAGARVRPSG